MTNLNFCEDYWDNPELKSEFKRFMIQMFRLDLSPWDTAGFWDSRYRPFSFFERNLLVSNVCVYSMDMIVKGDRRQVAQVSAVGTLPAYQRKGLSRELTRIAIEWARDNHDFYFLFADDNATAFYAQCGFRSVQEYKARIHLTSCENKLGAVQLDMRNAEHVKLVHRLAASRAPVSDLLGAYNDKLFMFWCLTFLRDFIYYIQELDIVVLLSREGGVLKLFDVVGSVIPTFSEMYPYICRPSDKSAEFLFMVDKMNLDNVEMIQVEGNGTHILGSFPLEGTQYLFPYTSHA